MKLFKSAITAFLLFAGIVILNSCDKKKQCTGTNSISVVLKDGTSNTGIKNVQLEIQIYDYNYSKDKGENYKTVGTVTTDDTGGFRLEYPCQDRDYDKIAIDALPPYGSYLHARESYSKNFGTKVFYYSTTGRAQVVLNPAKPIGNDTLYVGFAEFAGTKKWLYLDTFTSTVPKFWVKHRGEPGGGRTVYWGRGIKDFLTQSKKVNVIITGDPVIDSIFVKY